MNLKKTGVAIAMAAMMMSGAVLAGGGGGGGGPQPNNIDMLSHNGNGPGNDNNHVSTNNGNDDNDIDTNNGNDDNTYTSNNGHDNNDNNNNGAGDDHNSYTKTYTKGGGDDNNKEWNDSANVGNGDDNNKEWNDSANVGNGDDNNKEWHNSANTTMTTTTTKHELNFEVDMVVAKSDLDGHITNTSVEYGEAAGMTRYRGCSKCAGAGVEVRNSNNMTGFNNAAGITTVAQSAGANSFVQQAVVTNATVQTK
ncbi:hypothetical protein [Vibrio panuliri]|uniref:Uncharacterized protein n=1 Tax=Vibrio panuliri TaxID=1381081 RepID=A0ABX3FPE8_9VIBR|nr:hypothetical protein [Vibrio panuliri]KAB1458036.1 hypothetical protein F7O85_09990 [Vibrio panuliri]OLQ95079.1 hypothetical protein BIY20_06950 [Vibrio panuliri]